MTSQNYIKKLEYLIRPDNKPEQDSEKVKASVNKLIDAPKFEELSYLTDFVSSVSKKCSESNIDEPEEIDSIVLSNLNDKIKQMADRKKIREAVYSLTRAKSVNKEYYITADNFIDEVSSEFSNSQQNDDKELMKIIENKIRNYPELLKLRNKVDVENALKNFEIYLFSKDEINEINEKYSQAVEAQASTDPKIRVGVLESVLYPKIIGKLSVDNELLKNLADNSVSKEISINGARFTKDSLKKRKVDIFNKNLKKAADKNQALAKKLIRIMPEKFIDKLDETLYEQIEKEAEFEGSN